MKTIIKEINLLDIDDVEQAVSVYLGRKVSIAEMDCSLAYCIPADTYKPSGMYFVLTLGDVECDSSDLFYDEEMRGHFLNGKPLCLDEPWLPINKIFNFDVSAFNSFDSWTDMSD